MRRGGVDHLPTERRAERRLEHFAVASAARVLQHGPPGQSCGRKNIARSRVMSAQPSDVEHWWTPAAGCHVGHPEARPKMGWASSDLNDASCSGRRCWRGIPQPSTALDANAARGT